MKTRRQSRAGDLKAMGFIYPYENMVLSRIPQSVPYMQELAAKRAREYSSFIRKMRKANPDIKDAEIDKQFVTKLKRRYSAKGWNKSGITKANPKTAVFNMLRDTAEKPYKKSHPEYIGSNRYPKKSHHRSGEATSRKLSNSFSKGEQIRELRHAIQTYTGQDREFLVGKWQEELNNLLGGS